MTVVRNLQSNTSSLDSHTAELMFRVSSGTDGIETIRILYQTYIPTYLRTPGEIDSFLCRMSFWCKPELRGQFWTKWRLPENHRSATNERIEIPNAEWPCTVIIQFKPRALPLHRGKALPLSARRTGGSSHGNSFSE